MKMPKILLFIVTLALVGTLLMACSSGMSDTENTPAPPASDLISGDPQNVPIPGMVTMVDIGAHSCIPCKMMTPIIEELSKEYEGRAAIAFIDVWVNKDEAQKFGIRAIPTQIFYDAQGDEQYRHEGFMDKKSIVKVLKRLGVS